MREVRFAPEVPIGMDPEGLLPTSGRDPIPHAADGLFVR